MATKGAEKRLTREYKLLQENPTEFIQAHPDESDILQWYYLINGPPGTPYENGEYYGTLTFPPSYPFKPPSIRMITPSGRFVSNQRLCLSISDYHPESWNPAWSVGAILTGLLSLMVTDEILAGGIKTSDNQKRVFANKSKEWNRNQNDYIKNFTNFNNILNNCGLNVNKSTVCYKPSFNTRSRPHSSHSHTTSHTHSLTQSHNQTAGIKRTTSSLASPQSSSTSTQSAASSSNKRSKIFIDLT